MPTLVLVFIALLGFCIACLVMAFYVADKSTDFDERDEYITVASLIGMFTVFVLGAVVGSGLAWWIGG